MILNLMVENYVIIEKVSLDFKQGFSCFTGETGAGKSLVIDAIGILLGNRYTVDYIRKDCAFSRIEATVEINDEQIRRELNKNGYEDEPVYIFSRELSADNRTMTRINGRSCTLTLMKNVLSRVIDIHSQHDNQYLLNKKYHLELLDKYAADPRLAEVKKRYQTYIRLFDHLKELREKKYNPAEKEFLEYQINEIDELNLKSGEIEELETRFKLIANYEKAATKLESAINTLKNNNVKESIWQTIKDMETFNENELVNITTKLKESYFSLDEAGTLLQDYRNKIDFTETEINQIQDRLFEIKKIQRKFGNTYDEIIAQRQKMLENIKEINNSEDILSNLESETTEALALYQDIAVEYRQVRKTAAERLISAIKANLVDLDLPNSRFEVVFNEKEPANDGIDDIEFLMTTNKNVDLRPLAKVASGGELSRIMLGLKIIFTALQGISTVIFDEIDTGVSGTTAFSIGQKMQELASSIQVLSVTHLAQVAACANYHYYVNKVLLNDNTTTLVDLLSPKEQIQQLAVLGFGMVNDDSLSAAGLLLKEGQKGWQK